LALGALAFAVTSGAAAQTMAEIERRALADSPRLLAARERAEAARQKAGAAGVLADPMLNVEVMDLLPSGGRPTETLATVAQPLPAPGKRGAERAVARAEVAVAEAELAATERALLRDVRMTYAETWGTQQERHLQIEAHELVELLVETATALYGGGAERLLAPLEARVMLRRHELEQQEADARWLAAQTRLGEVIGSREPLLLPRLPEPAEEPFPDFEIASASASAPEVRVAERRVELAERVLEQARLGFRPDFSLAAGSRSMSGEGTELVVGVGIELPFFRRRRVAPLVAGAEHDLAAARADLESARLAARAELGRLIVERARTDGELERLRQGLLPESSAAFEAARSGLFDGSSTIARAVDLLRAWIDARVDLARLQAERLSTRGALLALLPDPVTDGGDR
jgi:outer membrane protein TolC